MVTVHGITRPFYRNPPNRKRLQGAADARRTGTQTYSLYFKCPTTKQMQCPVNAYKICSLLVQLFQVRGGIEPVIHLLGPDPEPAESPCHRPQSQDRLDRFPPHQCQWWKHPPGQRHQFRKGLLNFQLPALQ